MKRLPIVMLTLFAYDCSAQNYQAGEQLFKANCTACHKMDAKVIGPPLQNTVAEQGSEWTKKWISNNEALRASGDAHAIEIYEAYNRQVMPAYAFLSDEELTDLVTYLAEWKGQNAASAASNVSTTSPTAQAAAPSAPSDNRPTRGGKVILTVFLFACIMIAVTVTALYRAFKTMVEVNKELNRKAASEKRI